MDHFFTRNSIRRVFGFLEVNSVRKKWKIYPNFKIPEIFGFLDLGLSLEPDTWLYLFGHGISQTQPMWGNTQNFSSFGPLILYLPGGGHNVPPPLTQMCSRDPLTIRVKRTLHFPYILSGGDQMYNNRNPVNMYDAIFITECLHLDLDDIWAKCPFVSQTTDAHN